MKLIIKTTDSETSMTVKTKHQTPKLLKVKLKITLKLLTMNRT